MDSKLKAIKEFSDEMDKLSPEERELLKKSIDDIIKDTPQTTVAATRFKKLILKAGSAAAIGIKEIIVDILSETAKKIIYPNS